VIYVLLHFSFVASFMGRTHSWGFATISSMKRQAIAGTFREFSSDARTALTLTLTPRNSAKMAWLAFSLSRAAFTRTSYPSPYVVLTSLIGQRSPVLSVNESVEVPRITRDHEDS
jgi:hypothetical protein